MASKVFKWSLRLVIIILFADAIIGLVDGVRRGDQVLFGTMCVLSACGIVMWNALRDDFNEMDER